MKNKILSNAGLEYNFGKLNGAKRTVDYFEKRVERLAVAEDDDAPEKIEKLKSAIDAWNKEAERISEIIQTHVVALKKTFGKIPSAVERAKEIETRLKEMNSKDEKAS